MELWPQATSYISAMKTIVTASPKEAAEFVRAGEIAAFPTETVYGLGAHAFSPAAVQSIFDAKGRPADNPLIVHIFDKGQADEIAVAIPPYARLLMEKFFPGPLTLVLRKDQRVPREVTAGLATVGVRMPDHDRAIEFLRLCDSPVAAPSANRAGRPSPTTWQAVLEDLDGRIPCILTGNRTAIGLESTVVDCTEDDPAVLRPGAVSLEELQTVVASTGAVTATGSSNRRSPGLRHRHYAPQALVRLVVEAPTAPERNTAYIGISTPRHPDRFERYLVCGDVHEYAYELFDFFRACDTRGVHTIYCELPTGGGLATALSDRLRRASEATS